MKMDSRLQGDILLIAVDEERIDAAGTIAFKEKVRTYTNRHEGRVVLDMSRVDFLDSSGLGALVSVMKMLGAGQKLELAGCGTAVKRVLELTRMDRVFVLHDSVGDAVPGGRTAA